jgi:hypothetical protein
MLQMQMMSQMMPNMQQQKEGSSRRETIELAKLIGGDGKDSKEMLELVKEIQKQKDDQLRDMQKTQMEQIKELLQEKRISEI